MTPQLRRIARRQHALITRSQALGAGLTDRQIERLVGSGTWIRLAPGVYLIAGAVETWRQRVMAACLANGPQVFATSATAVHLYGLSAARRPERIELLTKRACSNRSRLAVVHRTLVLPKADVATIDNIPVTRPARSLIEYAAVASLRELEEAVDDAIIRGLVSLERLQRRHEELRASGRAGVALLDQVLASWADDMPQEVAEMRLLRRLMSHLSVRPVAQHEIRDEHGRLVARPDLSWPEVKCGYELTSFRWHSSPRAQRRDGRRSNKLKAMGWTLFDAFPEDLRGDGKELAELARPFLAQLSTVEVEPCAENRGRQRAKRGEDGRRSA